VDSTADFVTDGVKVGDAVINTTDRTSTTVTAIDDLNTLSLNADIMVSGEDYVITPQITTTYTGAQLFDMEFAQFGDDLYIVHGSHAPARLHRDSTLGWNLEDLTFTSPATVEDGELPVATVTPGATTGTGVTFTASADSFRTNDVGRQILYIDPTTEELLGKAIIVAYTSPTAVNCDIIIDFPDTSAIASQSWKIDLSPNTVVTPDSTQLGSQCTLTTVANTWKDTAQVSHVGRYVHIQNGIVRIDAVTTDLVCEGEVVKQLDALTATDVWTLQENSWTSTHGYPVAVGLFEERLWFGGTDNQPQNLWGSQTGAFDNFGTGADDSDAIDLLISDSIASPISWISSGRDLIVGGSGGEFTISSTSVITPSNRSIRLRSTHGSGKQQTDRIDNETIFVDSATTRIRSVRYNFDADSYIADDLLFWNDHLTKDKRLPGIKEIAVAQSPNNLIYAVLNNGDMIVGQFNRQQEILGWETFQTKGNYKSVATITVGDHDEVWVVVERATNGTKQQYIERFDEYDDNNGLDAGDGFSDSYGTFGTAISLTSLANAGSTLASGTNTSVTALKLVDSTADFVAAGVTAGDVVTDVDNNRTTHVTAVDDLNTLSLDDDYFTATAQNYTVIQAPTMTIPSGHGLVDDDKIIVYDALYEDEFGQQLDMDDINKKTYTVANQGATTIKLQGIDGSGWKTYLSDGNIYKKQTVITGLGHLEGQTISVKADNASSPDLTVSSGQVTMASGAGRVMYGLPYMMSVKTLKLPDNGQITIAGAPVRFINPVLRLFQSKLPTVNGELLPIRDSSMLMGIAPDLFSGDAVYDQTDWEDNAQILIEDSSPFPIMINAIFGNVEIGEV
jgi:hypothetical protein